MLEGGFYNMDCMEGMAQFPDKYFELAIVDVPYGIGADNMEMGKGLNKKWATDKNWDSERPSQKYFDELLRVTQRAMVWGGNYFNLPITGGWVFWDKCRDKDISFGDGELCWTNFLSVIKTAKIRYDGFVGADDGDRIHPCQKPVKLYEWLLSHYAKQGDKILDTHVGSASSLIACHNMGFEYWGFELDEDYYKASSERLNAVKAQLKLW
jgi:site-specific DNA-methyltransferase (adenine-specific)